MQILNQLKIEESGKKSFLEIPHDKYCKIILEEIINIPKSTIEVFKRKIFL